MSELSDCRSICRIRTDRKQHPGIRRQHRETSSVELTDLSHCRSRRAASVVLERRSRMILADAVDAPCLKLPPDLAKRIGEITDAVLEHHIDPPARQQMILGGIKALYTAAGLPVPLGLSRRVSALTTPEQLAALLADIWPKSTAKPVAARSLEEALLEGLLAGVSGGARLDLGQGAQGRRSRSKATATSASTSPWAWTTRRSGRRSHEVFEGGPADRAGVKTGRPDRDRSMASTPRAWHCATWSTGCAARRGPTSRSRSGNRRRRMSRTYDDHPRSAPALDRAGRPQAAGRRLGRPARWFRPDRLPADQRDRREHAARASQAGAAARKSRQLGPRSRPARCWAEPRSIRPSCWPIACSPAE